MQKSTPIPRKITLLVCILRLVLMTTRPFNIDTLNVSSYPIRMQPCLNFTAQVTDGTLKICSSPARHPQHWPNTNGDRSGTVGIQSTPRDHCLCCTLRGLPCHPAWRLMKTRRMIAPRSMARPLTSHSRRLQNRSSRRFHIHNRIHMRALIQTLILIHIPTSTTRPSRSCTVALAAKAIHPPPPLPGRRHLPRSPPLCLHRSLPCPYPPCQVRRTCGLTRRDLMGMTRLIQLRPEEMRMKAGPSTNPDQSPLMLRTDSTLKITLKFRTAMLPSRILDLESSSAAWVHHWPPF